MPDESLVKTTPDVRQQMAEAAQWTTDTELLAQIKEEISILAAEHRRKKPVEVPRPAHLKRASRARREPVKAGEANPEGYAHAIGVLKRNAKTVHVR